MNLFVRQTERADVWTVSPRIFLLYDTTEKHRWMRFAFVRYLCHRGMAARVVGNIVLLFCLAVSEFSAIQSVVLHRETPVRTELTRTRAFDYARRSTVPWKKAYGTIAINSSMAVPETVVALAPYALHDNFANRDFSRFYPYFYWGRENILPGKPNGNNIPLTMKMSTIFTK